MKKLSHLKKSIKQIGVTLLTVLFAIGVFSIIQGKNVYALEDLSNVKYVESNKDWKINFTSSVSLDENTKNSITVLDEKGKSIKVNLKLQNKRSIVVEHPKEGYESNKTYTLNIGDKVHNEKKHLSRKHSLKFIIRNKKDCLGTYDGKDMYEGDSINYKAGTPFICYNLKACVDEKGKKNVKTINYIDEKGKRRECLSTDYYVGDINIPLKINGWFKVNVGYLNNKNDFSIKDSASKEEFNVSDSSYCDTSKKAIIKEKVVFCSNFNNSNVVIKSKSYFSIAYIKLIPLTKEEIKLVSSKDVKKNVMIDIDGYSKFFEGILKNDECLLNETVRSANRNDFSSLNWCLGTTGLLNYNSKFAGNPLNAYVKYKSTMRKGDFTARDSIKYFMNEGKTPLSIIAKEGDNIGTATYASMRMNIFYAPSKYGFLNGTIYDKLKAYKQKTNWNLDYEYPQVRNYVKNVIKEATMTPGVDGATLDFCRYPVVLGIHIPHNKKVQIMNAFMKLVRESIPRSKKINVRIPNTEYLTRYGFDIKTWAKLGYVDVIIPSQMRYEKDFSVAPFVKLVSGTHTKIYKGIVADLSGTDYTKKQEDNGQISEKKYLDMDDYLRKIRNAYSEGAQGVYLFNTSRVIYYSEGTDMFSSPKKLDMYYKIYNQDNPITEKKVKLI